MEDFEFWNTGATPEETQQSLAEDLEYAEQTVAEQSATIATLRADLAEARAELEQEPTATLRQQLRGSQSALSKVMGELTEARESATRRSTENAKVQAELYQKIEAEQAQTREAYRQRDAARQDEAEARADVARFEAQLDAANRELAQARAVTMDDYNDLWNLDRQDYVALVTELRGELEAANKHVEVIRSLREHDHQQIEALTAELAQARAERDAARAEAKRLQDLIERRRIADTDMVCYVCERPMRSDQAVTDQDIDNICPACASETIGTLNHASRTLRAGAEQADARYRAELAQARAERDEAMKQRDFAKAGEDNMRFLKVLWENECGFYRAQSVARLHEIDMGRRTIRALVVACRAMWADMVQEQPEDPRPWPPSETAWFIRRRIKAKQSGQQAGE